MMKQNGFSLVEMLVSLMIFALIGLGTVSLMAQLTRDYRKATLALDTVGELGLGEHVLLRDLTRSGLNLNVNHTPDDIGNDFFEYHAFAPVSGTGTKPPTRSMTLSLDKKKYPTAKSEFIMLVLDKRWPLPLEFSPRKAYYVKSGSSCAEKKLLSTQTPVYNPICLYSEIMTQAQITFENPSIQTDSLNLPYFLQLTNYFESHDPTLPTAYKNLDLHTYFYIVPSDKLALSASLKVLPDNKDTLSTAIKQGNLNSTILPYHPFMPKTPLANLDAYLKNIPIYSGESSSVLISRFRVIKYKVEPMVLGGKSTQKLSRIELNVDANGGYTKKSSLTIASGFDSLKLTRASVENPSIGVKFDRQFRLNGNANGK